MERDRPVISEKYKSKYQGRGLNFPQNIVARETPQIWHIIKKYPDGYGAKLATTYCHHDPGIIDPNDAVLAWMDEVPLKDLCIACRRFFRWTPEAVDVCDSFRGMGLQCLPIGQCHVAFPTENAVELLRDYRNLRRK